MTQMVATQFDSSQNDLGKNDSSQKDLRGGALKPAKIKAWIDRLHLHNFRIHSDLSLSLPSQAPVILTGANGVGKTSLLEALSLFGAGSGLKMAKAYDLRRRTPSSRQHSLSHPSSSAPPPAPPPAQAYDRLDQWGVFARLTSSQQITETLGVEFTMMDGRVQRHNRVNGKTRPSLHLARHFNLFWLTPAMTRFFSEGAYRSDRRRFIDRLMIGLDARHCDYLTDFDKARRSRQQILKQNGDGEWLDAVEAQMAQSAVEIGRSRAEKMAILNQHMADFTLTSFPKGTLRALGEFETLILNGESAHQDDCYRAHLRENRARDFAAGRALLGPHQSDLLLIDEGSGQSSQHCSSGEVKALLINLVLASSLWAYRHNHAKPIILFDEMAAHLDEYRRLTLFDILSDWPAQIWITGTDRDIFDPMRMTAHFFTLCDGQAQPN